MSAHYHAYQFNKELSPLIDKIGLPLKEAFGITHFGFINFDNKKTMLRLANHDGWNVIYNEQKFYNDLELYDMSSVPINGSKKRILFGEPVTKHHKMIFEQDLWNFLLLYERSIHEGGFFFFGTTRNNLEVLNNYINYPHVFEHFVHYFKEKINDSVKNLKNCRMRLDVDPMQKQKIKNSGVDKYYDRTKISKMYLGERHDNTRLTQRETECLYLLMDGHTTKEIAKSLVVSPRTVEGFINNIKCKTGTQRKSKIIADFRYMLPA